MSGAQPLSGERKLWLAVLGEQVVMACREQDPMRLRGRRHVDPDAARRWFGSRDFRLVCDLAGLSPEWVLAMMRREIARPLPERHVERINLRHVSSGMSIVRVGEAT